MRNHILSQIVLVSLLLPGSCGSRCTSDIDPASSPSPSSRGKHSGSNNKSDRNPAQYPSGSNNKSDRNPEQYRSGSNNKSDRNPEEAPGAPGPQHTKRGTKNTKPINKLQQKLGTLVDRLPQDVKNNIQTDLRNNPKSSIQSLGSAITQLKAGTMSSGNLQIFLGVTGNALRGYGRRMSQNKINHPLAAKAKQTLQKIEQLQQALDSTGQPPA